MIVDCQNLSFSYENQPVLKDVSFQIKDGQFCCILGPSGSGKSTLLHLIAGFFAPDSGSLKISDRIVCDEKNFIPPEKRKIGIVFQDFALFPHLTVAGNILFGVKNKNRNEKDNVLKDILNIVQLTGYEDCYPNQLSGGQKQRVAVARALAPQPDLLLLDEPFSHFDSSLREKMKFEVRDIIKKTHTSAIMVTHDQNEAFDIADEVGYLDQGVILQWDTCNKLFSNPTHPSVGENIGKGSFISGVVKSTDGNVLVQTSIGDLKCDFYHNQPNVSDSVSVLIRPNDFVFCENGEIDVIHDKTSERGSHSWQWVKTKSDERLVLLQIGNATHHAGESRKSKLNCDSFNAYLTN